MAITIKETEYHQLNKYKFYEIEEDEVIEAFGSVEEFYKAVEEESPDAFDFIHNYDFDEEDDCWTMNTGGYETTIEVES